MQNDAGDGDGSKKRPRDDDGDVGRQKNQEPVRYDAYTSHYMHHAHMSTELRSAGEPNLLCHTIRRQLWSDLGVTAALDAGAVFRKESVVCVTAVVSKCEMSGIMLGDFRRPLRVSGEIF